LRLKFGLMLLNLSYLVGDYLLLVKYLFFCSKLLRSWCDFSDLTVSNTTWLGSLFKLGWILLQFCASTGHLKVRNQLFVKDLRISYRTCFLNAALYVWNSSGKLLLRSMQSLVRWSKSFARGRSSLFFLLNLILMFWNCLSVYWFDSLKSFNLVLAGGVL